MSTRMIDSAAREALRRLLGQHVRFDEPMARHTRFRIGGPADVLAEPATAEQLKGLLAWSAEQGIAYTPIGDGTNLLVRDGGLRGVTIRLAALASQADWQVQGRQVLLTASAGLPLRRLCALALRNGWQGLNFALGIPGCLGGALTMNAGTALGSMADILEVVSVLTPVGEIVDVTRAELDCGYRSMRLPARLQDDPSRPAVLLQARLRISVGERSRLLAEAREMALSRRRRQPGGQPSAGCFFRNSSPDQPAGRLIEAAGFKGRRVGDAQVSPRHANFIVNCGRATAAQVLELATQIEAAVAAQTGIRLQAEVRIVGDDHETR